MVNPVEFSVPVKLDILGSRPTEYRIAANHAECTALADRFGLIALDSLNAVIALSRNGDNVHATGSVHALLSQACTATGNPVPASIDETFEVAFIPVPVSEVDGEIELAADECETMFHDGKIVDLGEAAAQSLGLALNPYPRSDDAESLLRAAGVVPDDAVGAISGPFAALAALKPKGGG